MGEDVFDKIIGEKDAVCEGCGGTDTVLDTSLSPIFSVDLLCSQCIRKIFAGEMK